MRAILAVLAPITISAAALAAPQEASVRAPRLLDVGPMPDGPVATLTFSGAASLDGSPFDASTRPASARAWATVRLRADRRCSAAQIGAVVAQLATHGCERLVFEVERAADGAVGGFELRLGDDVVPRAEGAPITVEMHRRRLGVPPSSLHVPLRRARRGQEAATVGLLVPSDARLDSVLEVLEAIDAAGTERVAVDWSRPADPGEGAFALDLGPFPSVPVAPSAAPPGRAATVGFGKAPTEDTAPEIARGSFGGRYGGRGGQRPPVPDFVDGVVAFERAAAGRLRRAAWHDAPLPASPADVEAAALTVLALLATGDTLRPDGDDGVRAALGVLLGAQDQDGGFGPLDGGSQALAAYSLAAAYGLGARTRPVENAVHDALAALHARWDDLDATARARALIARETARSYLLRVRAPTDAANRLRSALDHGAAQVAEDPLRLSAWATIVFMLQGDDAESYTGEAAEGWALPDLADAAIESGATAALPLETCYAATTTLAITRGADFDPWAERMAERLPSTPDPDASVAELALQLLIARAINRRYAR